MAMLYRQGQSKSVSIYGAWLLYIYSIPYLVNIITKLITGEIVNLVLVSVVFVGVIISAFWMTLGLKNKAHYAQTKYSNTKPFPMMFLSSLVLGVSSFVTAWLLSDYNLFSSIGFGIAATVGCWLWYGIDIVNSKHISFTDINDADVALEILQNSETLIINIENSIHKIDNSKMVQRLERITIIARKVLSILYENPEKIRKSRRFLNTYLTGAESVVERYAAAKDIDNSKLEQNFREVLVNIEQVFTEQYDKLISSDVFDLDVDIEVLNTLLKKQGIS